MHSSTEVEDYPELETESTLVSNATTEDAWEDVSEWRGSSEGYNECSIVEIERGQRDLSRELDFVSLMGEGQYF